jgi:hypothetical protein
MRDIQIAPENSSLLLRVREFPAVSHTRKRKAGVALATYRVVLEIDVSARDIIKSRGRETLKDLRAEETDYLRAHIENEIGWLEQSFSRVEIESVTRVKQSQK